jgi:LmbE family N-acetylglucosaminyl deacetylase
MRGIHEEPIVIVLVIATHPDDEVLGCGGVMARHAIVGDQVRVLVVSRGVPEIFPPAEIEATREELVQAHRILGVAGVEFLNFPAPKLDTIPAHELADGIGRAMRRISPEIVYLPHRGDLHGDHKAVYYASLVAARPVAGCSVRRLLCYETLSETEWGSPLDHEGFIPTVFMDISAHLPTKLKAMSCYRSQLKTPPHSRSLEALEALARLRGATVSVTAAEAFMLVRSIE